VQRSYGIDLSLYKAPVVGWGYFLAASENRTLLDQLPLSLYKGNPVPTNTNFNISGMQLFGYPFFKSYGQLLYGDARGNLFELGADYEGPNNFTFGPPYTIWDAAMRLRVHPHARLQISAQNLFNLNTGTYLGRSLSGQGNFQPTVYLPAGSTTVVQGPGATANLNALPPRTIRMSLEFVP
jgi:outer membrane receptor protein involved in Fe transport